MSGRRQGMSGPAVQGGELVSSLGIGTTSLILPDSQSLNIHPSGFSKLPSHSQNSKHKNFAEQI